MTGMEDVLTAHAVFAVIDGGWWCVCGEKTAKFADAVSHQTEALQAAGFGSQHDAWVEGHDAGMWNADEPHPTKTNPYRK